MTELKNNKLFLALVALAVFNLLGILGFKLVVDKATDKVIQKLQKEYSPSPYGPGFDPDKVDLDKFKGKSPVPPPPGKKPEMVIFEKPKAEWKSNWESERGFSHE